jgi:hypothetical protein
MEKSLAEALGKQMGVQWDVDVVPGTDNGSNQYDAIVSQVASGEYGAGLSSLTENMDGREQLVAFVTYLDPPGQGPEGIAFPKGSGMAKATQAALKVLIQDGKYDQILKAAGQSADAIPASQVTIVGS